MREYTEQVKALREGAEWAEKLCAHETAKRQSDAADAIEELLDELTTIRKQLPHWISVEDALPKSESMVLVATKYGGVYYGFLNHSGKFYTANNTLYDSWCWEPDVTHWMPLPEPPKGVE